MLVDHTPYMTNLDAIVRPAAEHIVSNRYTPSNHASSRNNSDANSTKTTNNNSENFNSRFGSQFSTSYNIKSSISSIQNGISVNIDKFTQKLRSISATSSSARCARSIRLALESAGAKFNDHPIAAADWGNTLMKIGYRKITPAFDRPQQGDIYIINRTAKHRYGHIAGFSGTAWVSDFQQRSHDVYKEENVTYTYYRLAS